MNSMRNLVVVAALGVGLVACGPPKRVTRTSSDSTVGGDLSGYWNDIDAQQVAKVMVSACLQHPWASDHQSTNGGEKPVVKLAGVIKRTDDRNINTQFFSKQLEEQLLNSGRVRVVAAGGQEDINVRERARQSVHASDESAKSQQNELGADFTLQTVVNSQNETDGGGKSVRAYLVNMELLNAETNEKVWTKSHTIRKVIEQAGTSW